jgi:hypothetical protein
MSQEIEDWVFKISIWPSRLNAACTTQHVSAYRTFRISIAVEFDRTRAACRSIGGEVEASSTLTICRLPDSRRHQLSAIAPRARHAGGVARAGVLAFPGSILVERRPIRFIHSSILQ